MRQVLRMDRQEEMNELANSEARAKQVRSKRSCYQFHLRYQKLAELAILLLYSRKGSGHLSISIWPHAHTYAIANCSLPLNILGCSDIRFGGEAAWRGAVSESYGSCRGFGCRTIATSIPIQPHPPSSDPTFRFHLHHVRIPLETPHHQYSSATARRCLVRIWRRHLATNLHATKSRSGLTGDPLYASALET